MKQLLVIAFIFVGIQHTFSNGHQNHIDSRDELTYQIACLALEYDDNYFLWAVQEADTFLFIINQDAIPEGLVINEEGIIYMNPDYRYAEFLITLAPNRKQVHALGSDEMIELDVITSMEAVGDLTEMESGDGEFEAEVEGEYVEQEGVDDAPNPVLQANVTYTVNLLDYHCLDFCELTFIYNDQFTYTYVMAADNFPVSILHHDNEYGWTISDAFIDAKASILIGNGEADNAETGEHYSGEAVISVKLMN
jgi:hypothetical protein